jgi:hypothetical protein
VEGCLLDWTTSIFKSVVEIKELHRLGGM